MSNYPRNVKSQKKMLHKDDDAMSFTTNTLTKNVEWSIENEMILVEWCDVAQCYIWLNSRAHQKVAFMHAWFTIPTITLSTITGTASFAQSSLTPEYQVYAPMIIGTINILVGVLNTIQQYLKISELKESHRIAAIAWDKFSRNIRIELSKAPHERMDAGHFLKLTRQEYDRLMESSPAIPVEITREFTYIFSDKPGTPKQKAFEELKKPDICDSLVSSNQYRHHWYLNPPQSQDFESSCEELGFNNHQNCVNKSSEKSAHTPSNKPYIPPSYPPTTIGKLTSVVSNTVSNVGHAITSVVSHTNSSDNLEHISAKDIEKGVEKLVERMVEKGAERMAEKGAEKKPEKTDSPPNPSNSLTSISASLSAKNLIQNGFMHPRIPDTPKIYTKEETSENPFDKILQSMEESNVCDLSDNIIMLKSEDEKKTK